MTSRRFTPIALVIVTLTGQTRARIPPFDAIEPLVSATVLLGTPSLVGPWGTGDFSRP
jgi:hypothetical protein